MITQTFQYGAQASNKELAIVVNDVHVVYETISNSPHQRLKASRKQRIVGKLLGRDPKVDVHAVKGVSFMAYRGDSVGFLGINGAGKSTLLRIVSGNENPKSGTVFASTQPTLLGVSAALLPDLSGYENARLGCLAMGLSPEQTAAALPDIVEFTELGEAIYRPMRSYSSGMGARLRFAISTVANPDILIIDEALSTGDATFQERSKERMDAMLNNTGTILLVSHSPYQVEGMCNRAVWMHYGEMIADGDVKEITDYYKAWGGYLRSDKEKAQAYLDEVRAAYQPITIDISGEAHLKRITAKDL